MDPWLKDEEKTRKIYSCKDGVKVREDFDAKKYFSPRYQEDAPVQEQTEKWSGWTMKRVAHYRMVFVMFLGLGLIYLIP